jgi:branched-chain amino acid aminotransferase
MAKIFPTAFFKNKLVPIAEANVSVASSAVLYGLSVYTVFPIFFSAKGLTAFRLKDHFTRLLNSARIIGIDTFEKEWTFEQFEKVVREVVSANAPKEDVFVRVSVHVDELVPGTRSRGLSTALSMFLYEAKPILPAEGARLKTSVWRRVPDYAIPSRAKVNGAYVNSVLGKQDAIDSGYDDCLFLDADGHVCELSAANIFMVRNGTLMTPSASSDILEGINRSTIIELAKTLGIPVEECTIDLTELYIADELFASGTSASLVPILEVDKRVVGGGRIGAVTKHLRDAYARILRGEDPAFAKYATLL